MWFMGKELLAPWLHFPGLLVQVPPVQTRGRTRPFFLGFRVLDCAVSGALFCPKGK